MSTKASLLAENRALYLPAINDTFPRDVHRGLPASSPPLTAADLNFLDPNNQSFFYPFALYSAGQAASNSGAIPPCMVTNRHRSETMIVGDSGGYQIQSGKIQFDPVTTAPRMMKWMEQVADWSMVLDFPTGGISSGKMRPHAERLKRAGYDLDAMSKANGLGIDYNACLTQTMINNDRFVAERTPGATQFLNVLQGRSERESKHWYESVKHYPFEGWAFAGAHKDHFSLMLRRLLDMHADGHLQRCQWVHVLGVGTPIIGCLLTVVQRAVRKATGNTVQFSFDSATSFKSSGYGLACTGYTLADDGWSVQYKPFSELDGSSGALLFDILRERLEEQCKDGSEIYPADTLVSRNIRLRDIQLDNGRPTRDGAILLTHHNVQALLDAHSTAQRLFFRTYPDRPDPIAVPLSAKTIAEMMRLAFEELAGGIHPSTVKLRAGEWQRFLDALGT